MGNFPGSVIAMNPITEAASSDDIFNDIKDMYFGEIPVFITAVAAISLAVLLIKALAGR
jgi:hypothetical protein